MPAIRDLRGQQFGRLVVVERAASYAGPGGGVRWRCRCECGEERTVRSSNLRSGNTRSCGCLSVELSTARLQADPRCDPTAHGLHDTPEYLALTAARRRCMNPSDSRFAAYGGRGIEYRMPEDLGEATALLVEMIGPRPSRDYSLDRIDNDGHYGPGNLRWATRSEQRQNQRKRSSTGALGGMPYHEPGCPAPRGVASPGARDERSRAVRGLATPRGTGERRSDRD